MRSVHKKMVCDIGLTPTSQTIDVTMMATD